MSPTSIALRVLGAFWFGTAWAAAPAPPDKSQATFIFEPSGRRLSGVDRALTGFAHMQGRFQTTPTITDKSAKAVAKAAIDAALAHPALSGSEYDLIREPRLRYTILEFARRSQGPTTAGKTEWRFFAPDQEIAAIFIAELVRIHNEVALEEIRKERDEAEPELVRLTEQIDRYDAQIADLNKACEDLGVFWMDTTQVYEATSELQREIRRTEIDIAGLKAQLDSIKSRLQTWSVRAKELAQSTVVDPEVLRAVVRMQVEVEIELAGKLARQKAIEEQIAKLHLGGQRQAEAREASQARRRAANRLRELEQLMDGLEAKMQALQTQPCEIFKRRVAIDTITY